MSTRKIAELPAHSCSNPEHNPPGHMVYSDGIWEHVCPGCGKRQVFVVRRPRLNVSDAARVLGAAGGRKGGRARAAALTPKQRSRIARKAALARWNKAS